MTISSDEELRCALERCLHYLDQTRRYVGAARLSHCIDLLEKEFESEADPKPEGRAAPVES
jgi:hypothetical protein